jgi:hypothetical protein
MRIKKFNELFESQSRKIQKGDIVINNSEKQVGLVVSDRYYDQEYGDYNYDVYYRSMGGTISEEFEDDIKICDDVEYYDISAYVSIAKEENVIINIPEEYKDRYPEEYKEYKKHKKQKQFNL